MQGRILIRNAVFGHQLSCNMRDRHVEDKQPETGRVPHFAVLMGGSHEVDYSAW